MAAPLQTGKRSVNLAAPAVRPSRIRRDPPPVVKKAPVRHPDERDTRIVVIGIISFALAIVIVTIAIGNAFGWSPRHYRLEL